MPSQAANLIAYYPCGEASGPILDAHTGGHHLTETSGTMDAAAGPGTLGARDFEAGDTEYATKAHHADFVIGNNPFTIAGWVRYESLGTNRTLFGKNSGTGVNNEWQLGYGTTAARLRFSVENSTGTVNTTVNANVLGAPVINQWYFVVAWHDPGVGVGINVNAALTSDTVAFTGGVHANTFPVLMGAQGGLAGYHDGLISGVGMWRRVLSLADITWLYNGGAGRTYAEIVAAESAFNRLYLSALTPPYIPTTIRGAWDDVGGAVTRLLDAQQIVPQTYLSQTVVRSESNVADEYDVLLYRGVSGALSAQTLSGTINVSIQVFQQNAAGNFYWHLHAYVTQGDTDTPRGTILDAYRESTTEWSTTLGVKALQAAQSLLGLAVLAGDRIVVEIGYTARNTSGTAYQGTLQYNDGSYIEFSVPVAEEVQRIRVTQMPIEVASSGSSSVRVTKFSLEVASTPRSVLERVSSLGLEVGFGQVSPSRISALGLETAEQASSPLRMSALGVEIAQQSDVPTRVSLLGLEIFEPYVPPPVKGGPWMGDGEAGDLWME